MVGPTFVRRFAAAALACLLCLIAITGARINHLRERAAGQAAAVLAAVAAEPAAGLAGRLDALLAGDRRWRAVACDGSGGTIRAGSGARASLATARVRSTGGSGCQGLVRVLDADDLYPIIRDTAVAAIALCAILSLVLLAQGLRRRRGDRQPPALIPPPAVTPGTADSAPADRASETSRRTRPEPH